MTTMIGGLHIINLLTSGQQRFIFILLRISSYDKKSFILRINNITAGCPSQF